MSHLAIILSVLNADMVEAPAVKGKIIFCVNSIYKTDVTFTGLQTPSSCELVVGGEPQCWSVGHCLLVDDSFLHTVSHKGQ